MYYIWKILSHMVALVMLASYVCWCVIIIPYLSKLLLAQACSGNTWSMTCKGMNLACSRSDPYMDLSMFTLVQFWNTV